MKEKLTEERLKELAYASYHLSSIRPLSSEDNCIMSHCYIKGYMDGYLSNDSSHLEVIEKQPKGDLADEHYKIINGKKLRYFIFGDIVGEPVTKSIYDKHVGFKCLL